MVALKKGETRTCPVPNCGEEIVLTSGNLQKHFKDKHPEYEFHYEKMTSGRGTVWYEIVCDKCGGKARTFDKLVKYHGTCGNTEGSEVASKVTARPTKKKKLTKICPVPGCGIEILTGGGKTKEHFDFAHPEYEFYYRKKLVDSGHYYQLTCGICGVGVGTFSVLAKKHSHPHRMDKGLEAGMEMVEVDLGKPKTVEQEAIKLLADFTVLFNDIITQNQELHSENEELRKENEAYKENQSVLKEVSVNLGNIIDKMKEGFSKISI